MNVVAIEEYGGRGDLTIFFKNFDKLSI